MSDQDVTSRVLFRVLLGVWIVGVLIFGGVIYFGSQPVEAPPMAIEPLEESLDSLPIIDELAWFDPPEPPVEDLEPLMRNPQVVARLELANDRILQIYQTLQENPDRTKTWQPE